MLSADSPFLNIPVALDRKQAVFLDGMGHAAQIVELSYTRLCQALTNIANGCTGTSASAEYTHVFLDAWALIDAVDRFRCLWEMQPNASSIPDQFSAVAVREQLQEIRDVRNVSAHIAQKIDQIVSLNSSVLGAISWVSVLSADPIKVKTYFIRPGIMLGTIKEQFAMPSGEVDFNQGSGCISVTVGKHKASLSLAYKIICSVIAFAEANLNFAFREYSLHQRFPVDMFGSAEFDTGGE